MKAKNFIMPKEFIVTMIIKNLDILEMFLLFGRAILQVNGLPVIVEGRRLKQYPAGAHKAHDGEDYQK